MGILRYLRRRLLARRMVVVAAHLALYALAWTLAWLLRFDFRLERGYLDQYLAGLALVVVIRAAAGFPFEIYGGVLRYAGIQDLVNIIKAVTAGTLFFALATLVFNLRTIPRSIYALDWFMALVLTGGFRFALRVGREILRGAESQDKKKRLLILGAGDAGESLLRDIQRRHRDRYQVVGFLDDNSQKLGLSIHGVKVLGPIFYLGDYVPRYGVDEVIVAIPSASGSVMRDIFNVCRIAGVRAKTLPGIEQLIDGAVNVTHVREVAIEDLLGREPVQLDEPLIDSFVRDKTVLITGAGGSIGSELCRQMSRFMPRKLVVLDRSEPLLFSIYHELYQKDRSRAPVPVVADVSDRLRMEKVFCEHRPQVVFHAAAHKHVPMMEWNPGEAIKNNVLGSMICSELANHYQAQAFVFISTDKAVNPSSIMGASKRAAEMFIHALSQHSQTAFTAVRFGNVLGSTGSVIPIFKEQIARGGPVTVTHPQMKRYFMTIPEACQLVMQAAAMGQGGEIFVLDMGQPVKIVDLARDLIRLSGYEPEKDIKIEFTGLRPGEKLFEELGFDEEKMRKTRHPKIYIGKLSPGVFADIKENACRLLDRIDTLSRDEIMAELKKLVPEFLPSDQRPLYALAPPSPPAVEKEPEGENNPLLDPAWELAVSVARQAGFSQISWVSHGLKPRDQRDQVLGKNGGEKARFTRSVPITTLSFLEVSFTFPGRPGGKVPAGIRDAARAIGQRVSEQIRKSMLQG